MTRPEPLDKEVLFDGRSLISETDTQGIIIFVNRKFVEMSGYTKDEALGQPHNILRHPDMPKTAFEQMWKTIQSGKIWEGYVKNLRKDGKFYWVIVNIVPKLDDNGTITGYIASRKVPKREQIQAVEQSYAKMVSAETKIIH
ncbi:PAS domain S-box protein [Sulfurimonas sp. MAG313]|nr:PAS domain S-box protein [Sulfurimonas sp. MAG313]MDF1881172.1 PAS domain S-box protein [Sulfurimonas sp. MAG313]